MYSIKECHSLAQALYHARLLYGDEDVKKPGASGLAGDPSPNTVDQYPCFDSEPFSRLTDHLLGLLCGKRFYGL